MLRITAEDKPRILTLRLEGRLDGPWAAELERCWRGMLAGANRPTIRVDLTGVTFVDASGKARLAAMHRKGAEFIAADCLTKAIVAEITAEATPAEEDPSCPRHT
jgi:anti-anti-sigma regulatory factor